MDNTILFSKIEVNSDTGYTFGKYNNFCFLSLKDSSNNIFEGMEYCANEMVRRFNANEDK